MAVVSVSDATLHPAMCRLCLLAGPDTATVSIFSVANGCIIAEMARHCLGIDIAKDDSPYENVCSPCIVSLVSMYELYQKYRECNRVFLQMVSQSVDGSVTSSPVTVCLEDIIEEDYSIDDEGDSPIDGHDLVTATSEGDATTPGNGNVGHGFDDSVYYMQDFGVYVRSGGDMDGLVPGQHTTEETEWTNAAEQSNGTLMEELNAQVARLDGQEMTTASPKPVDILLDVQQPPVTMETVEMPTDRECEMESLPSAQTSSEEPASNHEEQHYQDPKHHCFICETSFPNDIDLVNHFPAHFLDVPQDCTLCGTHYRTVMNFNRHLAYHQPGRPYKCDSCERRFNDRQAFQRHTTEFHRQPQGVPLASETDQHVLVCDVCGKMYVLAEPYEQHVRQHERGLQQYHCKLCQRSFPRNIYLLFHLETHAKQRPHRCRYCSIPFASLYLKNFHEKRHPGEGISLSLPSSVGADREPTSRRCPLCLTMCRSKQRLLAHIEAFHPADTRIQLLQCSFNECRLKFLDLGEFQSHITDHRVGERFPCTQCVRVFKRQRLLAAHLRTVHGMVAPRSRDALRCAVCSKNFRTERTHRLHLETVHQPSKEPPKDD
ncbi:GDNF-inducible zinc finger protein 1-like [Anopheles cruzii]|uniref:GDNF-inducible zinc finger protein 1-like n=1 Tax=Anopheles cruzii TaxID=68878 RepID=UPI0022EC4B85|nr:GDNF-inducible zinc finger protein 1-like [Anopheles cruzii]